MNISDRDLDDLAATAHDILVPGTHWEVRTEFTRAVYRRAIRAVLDRYEAKRKRVDEPDS